jgi:hypothetical protein
MVTDAWALPDSLVGATFTTAEARALRVGKRRLRSQRVKRVQHGLWVDAGAELTFAQRCEAALRSASPEAWISHASAAQLLGIPLPPRLRDLEQIDVTVPSPTRAPRGSGIRGRQRDVDSTAITLLDGLRVSAPAQALVDAADYLSFDDLVAVGDAVVWEQAPLASIEEVIAAIDGHAGRRGHRELLRAARVVHPRSRSRTETINRLQLLWHGAPEPWCNVPVLIDDGDAVAPDVAYWPAGMVIEVEGDQHRVDRQQWLVDLDRYNRYQRCDIEVHRVVVSTVEQTRRQLGPIVQRVLQRWDASRSVPPLAPFFGGAPVLGAPPWLPLEG